MANDILIIPGDAQIQFSGSSANNIYLQVNSDGTVTFYGNSGSLFSVEDTFTGSLFSVNDISGLPVFDVLSDYTSSIGHLLPLTGSTYDLGSTNKRWRDLYLSGSSIYLGDLILRQVGSNTLVVEDGSGNVLTVSASFDGDVSAALPAGIVSSSGQVDYTGLSNVPSGIVSSSGQVDYTGLTNIPSGIVSSSTQVDYTQIQNVPSGIVSSSGQVSFNGITDVPAGLVSSSTQVDYDQIQNVPDGLVSSSGQISHDSTTGVVANQHIDHSTVSVIAGSGLTGGGTIAANRTINVGAGTGIDVAADAISVDVSDFMTNGADNRVVTATGTDAMNAETNLTFDGTKLVVNGGISVTGSSGIGLQSGSIFTEGYYDNGTIASGGTLNVNWANGNSQKCAANLGNITIAVDQTSAKIGTSYTMKVRNISASSRTVSWSGVDKWVGGSAPVASMGAGNQTTVQLYIDEDGLGARYIVGHAILDNDTVPS